MLVCIEKNATNNFYSIHIVIDPKIYDLSTTRNENYVRLK